MTKAQIQQLVVDTARRFGLNEQIALAQIDQESRFNPNATGRETRYGRAKGLAQFIDSTAAEYGVRDPYDPVQAMEGWGRYMTALLKQFGSYELALAAYNGGPGNVRKYGGIPPFQETQDYVRIIMSKAGAYATTPNTNTTEPQASHAAWWIVGGIVAFFALTVILDD